MGEGDNLPKISIVTATYNQSQFLESTIRSIIDQQYPNLEYIIVDGGSTDGTAGIIDRYRSVFALVLGPSRGQYQSINQGFSHATGEILAWLNSDDMYFPWTLRTVADVMTKLPQIEWLSSLFPSFWDYHGFNLGTGRGLGFSRDAFLDGCFLPSACSRTMGWIQQESTFWRRDLWERCGAKLDPHYDMAADFDLWARFYEQADLYGVESPLAGFRYQLNQKTKRVHQYVSEATASLQATQKRLNWHPNHLRKTLRFMGFQEIPKIRRASRHLIGYRGMKVVRKNPDEPGATWIIQEHRFL